MSIDHLADLAHPTLAGRLAALRALATGARLPARAGTNNHVHTNHSFGVFRSPSDAVWRALEAGVEVFGINDFFTTSGHAEFAAACAAVRLPATFSLECIAMDRAAEAAGVLTNDPGNPGKTYLCGKGVTTPDEPRAAATLAAIRSFQEGRNRALIARLDAHFRAAASAPGPSWAQVVDQTPHGNTTERHVAKAVLQCLTAIAARTSGLRSEDAFAALFTSVVGSPPKPGDSEQQNQIRGNLLKAGKPCYVAEDPAAFPSVAEIRALFLQLGAIPTYPVLGNPETGGEKDIPALCDRLQGWGFHALELIPARNTDARVAQVLAEAKRRGWPVFDGTEHNTPAMEPLLTRWGTDIRFRGQFRDGALVLLGHQALVQQGRPGYLDGDGRPLAGGYAACLAEGQRQLVSQGSAMHG
jgi:hypothetical protein